MEGGPGLLPRLEGNCTGAIPCPPGSHCLDGGVDKGILALPGHDPYFVVYLDGDQTVEWSCGEFSYGFKRVDPLVDGIVHGLFYLRPRRCPAGAFLEAEECTLCPEGTYSQDEGALFVSSCIACGTGTFSPLAGTTVCLSCQTGTFQDEVGASLCELCPAGTFQVDQGRNWCDPCPSGSFSALVGQSVCQTCAADMIQAGEGMADCTPCNGSSEFSSPGDSQCRLCGVAPDALEGDSRCPSSQIPVSQESIWVSVKGSDGDECAGSEAHNTGDLIDTGVVRFFEWARCQRTLVVLGRPELSRSMTDQPLSIRQNIKGLRVIPYDKQQTSHACQQFGFGFLFVALTEYGTPAFAVDDLSATFRVMDQSEKHLLFQGSCHSLHLEGTPMGRCSTSDFCPNVGVVVHVSLSNDNRVSGKELLNFGSGLSCPPTVAWVALFLLDNPFVTRFPGSSVCFRVSVLNPPSTVVAFQFTVRVRPGFSFISFDGLGRHRLVGDTLSVEGDSSSGGLELGNLTLRLDADHQGLLRALHIRRDGFRVMLKDGKWYTIGVQTDSFTCRRDGLAEVMVDYPRTTSLVVFVRRTWLVHWRSVQSQGADFPVEARVLAVRNNERDPKEVHAQCRSLTPDILVVTSCSEIRAHRAGTGSLGVIYGDARTTTPVLVVRPSVTSVRVVADASGRLGRVQMLGRIMDFTVDIAPFVLGEATPSSSGLSMHDGAWFHCHQGFEGNVSVGDPVLFSWPCITPVFSTPDRVVLISGSWTSEGAFRLNPSVLSSSSDVAGVVFFRGLKLESLPVVSRDLDRATSDDSGSLFLVRRGFSPRCVFLRDGQGVGWGVHVLPPAPVSLRVELFRSVLVVEQDLWKLVPSHTSLKSAQLWFSDGSSLDVTKDNRLTWAVSSLLVKEPDLTVRALVDPGNATVAFRLMGLSCVNASASVMIFQSSVVSGRIMCPSCPNLLAAEGDPLGNLLPAVFPAAISARSFVLRRSLVDGSIHDSSVDLRIRGGRVTDGGLVVADGAGLLGITSGLSDEGLEIPVVRRWTVQANLLCNGQACDQSLNLTVPGNEAVSGPFFYSDRLELKLELTLFNGTTIILPWMDHVSLFVNGTSMSPSDIRLSLGEIDLRVVFDSRWELDQREFTALLRVVTVSELRLYAPSVLYQIHCSGFWDVPDLSVVALLSDGSSSSVAAELVVDGGVLQLDAGSVRVGRHGLGFVQALFGKMNASATVQVSLISRLFNGVSLDSVPDKLEIPLGSSVPIQPVLFPKISSFNPALLLQRVVRWVMSEEGVVDVGGDLKLLSDYHSALKLSAVIRSCQGEQPVVVSKDIVVNIMPDKPGQVDLGSVHGQPFRYAAVNERLEIPVFLYAPVPLLSFQGTVSAEALDQIKCLPGELPFSQCQVLSQGIVDVSGDFPSSQRVGRLLIGVLSGRVLLDAIARVQVFIAGAVLDGLGDVGNTTWSFSLKFGRGVRQSLRSPLNKVVQGALIPIQTLSPLDPEPDRLETCCHLTSVGTGSFLEKWVPSSFEGPNIILWFNESSRNVDLLDPRIQVGFDPFVLRYDDMGHWMVLKESEFSEESTSITVSYFHPSTLFSLQSVINVSLAKASEVVLRPTELVLHRIHCSPTMFETGDVGFALLVRGVRDVIPLDGRGSVVEDPAVARVSSVKSGLSVIGVSSGQTRVVFTFFGLQASCTVTVLDQSVVLLSLHLPDPYVIASPLNGLNPLRASGVLENGRTLADLAFLSPSLSVRGPVQVVGGGLQALGNTLPSRRSSIRVAVTGCSGSKNLSVASELIVKLFANLSIRQRADALVEAGTDGFNVTLVGPNTLVFAVELDTDAAHIDSCIISFDHITVGDCAIDFPRNGSLVFAGVVESSVNPIHLFLGSVTPMPTSIHGVVEVYAGVSSMRMPVVAGRFGPSIGPLTAIFPLVDTATVGRSLQDKERTVFELGLITGRTRLINSRFYSNENELSVMFKVTDRFLRPDETQTTIYVTFFTDVLPDHPQGMRLKGGGMRVLALHVLDGWYAVQWLSPIPRMRLRLVYEASTSTSLRPWNSTLQEGLVTGRPLHACPRFATDDALFRVEFQVPRDRAPAAGFAGLVACAAHVAARRVSVVGPSVQGMFSVSVDVESFIRIHQVREAIMNLTSTVQKQKNRHLLADAQGLQMSVRYINDTADRAVTCPVGFYFSSNGTYVRLPQHAAVGVDCYGMACLSGYVLLNEDCVPATVGIDIVWICVLVVLGVTLAVSCILCALHFGKTRTPPEPVELTADPWPVTSACPFKDDPIFDDEYGFKNVVIGSYMDEYSRDMLDDDFSDAVTVTKNDGRG